MTVHSVAPNQPEPKTLDDLQTYAMHAKSIIAAVDHLFSEFVDNGHPMHGAIMTMLTSLGGFARVLNEGLDSVGPVRRCASEWGETACHAGGTSEERAAYAAKVLEVEAPAKLLDRDGAPTEEVLTFAALHGVSLDWIFLGDIGGMITEISRRRKREDQQKEQAAA